MFLVFSVFIVLVLVMSVLVLFFIFMGGTFAASVASVGGLFSDLRLALVYVVGIFLGLGD